MTDNTQSDTNNNLPEKQSSFLLYTGSDGAVKVDVFIQNETLWLTQAQIAELFGVQKPAITKHLSNIVNGGAFPLKNGEYLDVQTHS